MNAGLTTAPVQQETKAYAIRCGVDLTKNLGYTVVRLPDGSYWPIVCVEELFSSKNSVEVVQGWQKKHKGYKQVSKKPRPQSGKARFRRELQVLEGWS